VKQGHPVLIGETLDNQVKAYTRSVQDCGGPITLLIAIALGKAAVRKFDASMLADRE